MAHHGCQGTLAIQKGDRMLTDGPTGGEYGSELQALLDCY